MYQKVIKEYLINRGWNDVPSTVIEAYMRCTYGTLDHLDRAQFNRAIISARKEALIDGPDLSNQVGKSYA